LKRLLAVSLGTDSNSRFGETKLLVV
jgi:hypothetical protein